ncbi:uncharacterized protein LOC113227352 [Hyposmocoma kahamanoa]|uniref:uncharacterized protein LOC113227352 n=1 Tax=Hyposmocoma kahamanoa TaxID=1477025 RepID=UPI000E6D7706|nr:uncharacterized protein LOC113227352 [Hyposmocoma kahamanoa]
MKFQWLYLSFVAVSVAAVSGNADLLLAEPCDAQSCSLPDCQCSSTTIPGNLAARDTPQFVTLTFTGSISPTNMDTYRRLFYFRQNSNGCSVGATFFVKHEYTYYHLVNELYNLGFEIALNSISHRYPQSFWAEATYEDIVEEIAGQKSQLAYLTLIPIDEIKGVRFPFLQTAGNVSTQVMKENRLYDSSWSTVAFHNPGLWPYTLDYASTQDCNAPPCATASFPGVWVSPVITWRDLQGFPCSSVDACTFVPRYDDEEGWFQFIMQNFERHYLGTRSPFEVFISQGLIATDPAIFNALERFIEFITRLPNAFMVNKRDVIEWSKNPVPIDEYRQKDCPSITPTISCTPRYCSATMDNDVSY